MRRHRNSTRSCRSATTLVELLRQRADQQPERHGYCFLLDRDGTEVQLTYGELDQRARGLGAALQRLGTAGERALLLYPPGLDYIAAFFGCLQTEPAAATSRSRGARRKARQLQKTSAADLPAAETREP